MAGHTETQPICFIDLKQVSNKTQYSRTTIYRLIQEGNFPKQVKLGPNRSVWVESEIEAWMADRIDQRESA